MNKNTKTEQYRLTAVVNKEHVDMLNFLKEKHAINFSKLIRIAVEKEYNKRINEK
jgi:hypothetical protein